MTRRSDLMLEDLTGCDHKPETGVSENGVVVAWLCRCGRRFDAATLVPPPSDARRKHVLNSASDACVRFLYYDRKADDELPVHAIEEAVIAGEVSVDEIVDVWRKQLELSVADRRETRKDTES